MRIHKTLVLVIAMAPVLAAGQLPPNAGPPVDANTRFEVVAIKAYDEALAGQILMRTTPAGFESAVPIAVLVRLALQKPDYQIAGTPRWVETERYAIKAKPPAGVSPTATPVLISNLLKDRFQLQTHLETREQPIFHLVMARSDRRLGPDLKPTSAECQALIAERAENLKRGGPLPALPTSLPGPNDPLPCGFVRSPLGQFAGSGRNIAQEFVRALSDLTGRPVIDKTGLAGLYDFTLKFAYEGRMPLGPLGSLGPMSPGATPVGDPDAPSLSVALQEQLGLKLESTRGPVEIAVIDKIEKPTLD
jgi:uncharacterized protein (TIGR03435 family)